MSQNKILCFFERELDYWNIEYAESEGIICTHIPI